MFKDDNLVGTPGEKFSYTTHGFTLLSAVLEKASEKKFKELLTDFFQRLGMRHTYTDDQNHRIIVNRTKCFACNLVYTTSCLDTIGEVKLGN